MLYWVGACSVACITVDKLRDGLHHERLEKEAMEESCQQLKKTTTRLQEKVDQLTLDQSQSMSVEDHRAALNEMQQWVALGVWVHWISGATCLCL